MRSRNLSGFENLLAKSLARGGVLNSTPSELSSLSCMYKVKRYSAVYPVRRGTFLHPTCPKTNYIYAFIIRERCLVLVSRAFTRRDARYFSGGLFLLRVGIDVQARRRYRSKGVCGVSRVAHSRVVLLFS